LLGDVAGRSLRQILFWVRYDYNLSTLAEFVVRSRDLHQFKAFRDLELDDLLAASRHTQIFAQFHFCRKLYINCFADSWLEQALGLQIAHEGREWHGQREGVS
jgi:hypothetical protein